MDLVYCMGTHNRRNGYRAASPVTAKTERPNSPKVKSAYFDTVTRVVLLRGAV